MARRKMTIRLIGLLTACGLSVLLAAGGAARAALGAATRPAASCLSDRDCPPGYLCTSMLYPTSRIMPICLAGPTKCSSNSDCPLGYECDLGSWLHVGPAGLVKDAGGSCSPQSKAGSDSKTTLHSRHRRATPN